MNKSEEFTQWVDYEGLELELKATYTPATRGQTGDYGVPIEPDSPDYYELNDVSVNTVNEFRITERVSIHDLLRQEVLTALEDKLVYPEL